MNIETLRLFVDAARCLSFAAVADKHDVDPSSISRAISGLESHLGVRLFHRTTRNITLTEAGEVYLAQVASIVEAYDQAEESARSIRQAPKGLLKLTASVAFGECVIAPLVPEFNARYPELQLELHFTDTNLDLVASGMDMAVRLAPKLSGDIVATKLMPTAYKVVASQQYIDQHMPINQPEDLTAHTCTVFALPQFRTEWLFRSKGSAGGVSRVPISAMNAVSSALSIRSLVKNGSGPALLADWLVQDDLKTGRLLDLFPSHEVTATDFDTAAWIAYPSRAFLPEKVRVMIDFLKESLSER